VIIRMSDDANGPTGSGQMRSRLSNIASLVRGTVLAQLVFLAATPLLTRIYTPAELGIFGVYMAFILVGGKLSGLKYDLAIVLPKRDELAIVLIFLTLGMSCVTTLGAWLVYQLGISFGVIPGDAYVLQHYILLLVVGMPLFVLYEALGHWMVRKKQFSTLGTGKLINALALALLQLCAWFSDANVLILLGAYPIAMLIGSLFLMSRVDKSLVQRRWLAPTLLRRLTWRYRKFARYTTWSTAAFEFSQSLPLFLLTYFFGNAQAGYFFLARRIGLVPTSIVGRAITQVNHSDMVDYRRQGILSEKLLPQIRLLQWVAVIPAVVLAVFAPAICAFALGDDWRAAGYYLQLLTPYVLIKFIFSPIAAIVYVAGWQRLALVAEVSTIVISAGLLIGFSLGGSIYQAVAGYFGALFIAHTIYMTYLAQRLSIPLLKMYRPLFIQAVVITAGVLLWWLLQ